MNKASSERASGSVVEEKRPKRRYVTPRVSSSPIYERASLECCFDEFGGGYVGDQSGVATC